MNVTELEVKTLLESGGFKVIKVDGKSTKELSSRLDLREDYKVLNFLNALESYFGIKGFPDFFVYKKIDEKTYDFGFVEVKYKSELSFEQEIKMRKIMELFGIWSFVAYKPSNK